MTVVEVEAKLEKLRAADTSLRLGQYVRDAAHRQGLRIVFAACPKRTVGPKITVYSRNFLEIVVENVKNRTFCARRAELRARWAITSKVTMENTVL